MGSVGACGEDSRANNRNHTRADGGYRRTDNKRMVGAVSACCAVGTLPLTAHDNGVGAFRPLRSAAAAQPEHPWHYGLRLPWRRA